MRKPAPHGCYFYLSYAPSPSQSERVEPGAAYWVRNFFNELCTEVARRARPRTTWEIGNIDYLMPAGTDRAKWLGHALGSAEVFVPLYSPSYLQEPGPLGERESFRRRLALAGQDARPANAEENWSEHHVQPVLWVPLPSPEHVDDRSHAIALGADLPPYGQHGLRSMSALNLYYDEYMTIVRRLARRIVEVAEEYPLGTSFALTVVEVAELVPAEKPFVIAVLAPPDRASPVPHPSVRVPGQRPLDGNFDRPAADSVAAHAKRQGLRTEIVDFETHGSRLDNCPGVLLIDPWAVADEAAQQALAVAVGQLREWVSPVIVLDETEEDDAEQARELVRTVTGILAAAPVAAVTIIRHGGEFERLMPRLLARTRRRFLSNAPVFPPGGPPPGRPRLADGGGFPNTNPEERR